MIWGDRATVLDVPLCGLLNKFNNNKSQGKERNSHPYQAKNGSDWNTVTDFCLNKCPMKLYKMNLGLYK